MSVIKVTVKWGNVKFEDLELYTDQPASLFKAQLNSLTGIDPDRQKILVKGMILKDDVTPKEAGIEDGQQIMLLGSTEKPLSIPTKKIVFEETLSQVELNKIRNIPVGLVNLGNTCYFNATLQCLRAIPEFRYSLQKMGSRLLDSKKHLNLTKSICSVFDDLDNCSYAVAPVAALQILREVFPQFAEKCDKEFMQQDADECWGHLMCSLSENVSGLTLNGDIDKSKYLIEQYFTGSLETKLKCDENEEEKEIVEYSQFNKLPVNIGRGSYTRMITDLAAGFNEKIEKNSESTGKSSIWTKTSAFSRLPHYLVINFFRFQWKKIQKVKAKILKSVEFPYTIDLYPMCIPELQERLSFARNKIQEHRENIKKRERERKLQMMESDNPSKIPKEDLTEEKEELYQDVETQVREKAKIQNERIRKTGAPEDLINDIGANKSGYYDLLTVLSHMGRAADSGHYITWTKGPGGIWYKLDDEKVTEVAWKDIKKLSGGGDWHSAYICIYESKDVPE